ncbi:glutaredoxin 3 [Legionella jordanis]|uniref:Glutaredoxin n=1 Tax=Legionella jordanis TaxID=456 RepID=A0A0W0V9D5_9GAMM|nr:glutaredoxin 3 [Legionella jordanis]KTD16704.1 glutaredoxin Grx [Legionella jordanis]RMX03766.1 glutaredoxin 3 [Legionella jordanis]RMX22172.1 glutaredoxin 3 [Legionella jordanis]VEH11828.1 glutaredoxin Grx [Legionella jordanis]HAT8712863.1 glutaredoxin 3 [Legionella jordanis]
MAEVIMYSTAYCPYCTKARDLLDRKGITYTDIRVDDQPDRRDEMITKSGRRTVPQIFINGQHIGGCDDMYALEEEGHLDKLLRG